MLLPPQPGIVYGPARSRQLGRSLGVNLLPIGTKMCTMNCAYCHYAWTRGRTKGPTTRADEWPTPRQVETAVLTRLQRAEAQNELLDRLTVAGHGEPTLHPYFEEVIHRLRRVRDHVAPGLPLAILSNSTTVVGTEMQRALALFDERYMKLDAGDPIAYVYINGPGASIEDIVDALARLPSVVVQAMFVTDPEGRVDNTTDGAVSEWLAAIERVRPSRVDIYTIGRPPALGRLRPASTRRLREIANQVRAAGIAADVVVRHT